MIYTGCSYINYDIATTYVREHNELTGHIVMKITNMGEIDVLLTKGMSQLNLNSLWYLENRRRLRKI